MNHEILTKMFNYINAELFDGMLNKPHFYIMDYETRQHVINLHNAGLMDFYGLCSPDRVIGECEYFIAFAEDLTPNELFNTMVHELIHVHCMEDRNYCGHSSIFRKMTEKAVEQFYGHFEDI